MLFQTTKIQIFESNSQPNLDGIIFYWRCFRLQRYKFLKAIHNGAGAATSFEVLFQTTKIQIFESNSQPAPASASPPPWLFQTTKIQIFESNSQQVNFNQESSGSCFRLQRYKFLKAIHNYAGRRLKKALVVSDYKDTNF